MKGQAYILFKDVPLERLAEVAKGRWPELDREEGHYWVKVAEDWTVGHWAPELARWLVIGDDEGLDDFVLDEVGPRITPPDSDTAELGRSPAHQESPGS